MEKKMAKNEAHLGDVVDLELLMDELSVSDRRLEMTGGIGRPTEQAATTGAPGKSCPYDCN